MRSNAKASSAGSNLRQATGLGRIFRGVDATRGASSDSDGSGAPSHRLVSRVPLVALLAPALLAGALGLAMLSSTALATHPPKYNLVESFGPDGSDSSSFVSAASAAFDQSDDLVYVLDDGTGILYKFDSDGTPVNWGGTSPYISGHEISGLTFPSGSSWELQVAVDSTSHQVYVTDANSVRAFLANGEPAEFTAGPGIGTGTIGGFGRLGGIATDANGYIYASDKEAGVVKIFKPSGEEVTEFSAANAANLAVDPTGAVYVNRRQSNVLKFTPSAPLPVTAATTYAPAAEPVEPQSSFSAAVHPTTSEVYISKTALSPGIHVYDESGEFITVFGQTGSEGALTQARGLAIDGDATKAYVANWANSGVSQVKVFELEPPLPPGPPEIGDLVVRDVGNTSAVLRARINPNSVATTYHFEYGLQDCAVSVCASIPLSPAGIGDGHDLVAVSHAIGGLLAASTYHYRVLAQNSEGSDEESGTFRTQGSGLGFQLIDRRAWEMVSPSAKYGAIIFPGLAFGHVQAAADGNGLAYLTGGSIEENPAGTRAEGSSALAHRGAGGEWSSKDITPPNSRVVPLSLGQQSEYKLFNADLSQALLEPRDGTNLSPEASERAPYWRQNSEPPLYRPLVTAKEGFANVPPGTVFGGGGAVSEVGIRAATPSLDHVVLRAGVSLADGAPAGSIYKWFAGQLEPVAVLPDSEGGGIVQGMVGSAERSTRHAISDDGARVFWASLSPQRLYVRDTVTDETARIDIPSDGSGAGTSAPVFQGASADGSAVFFTDSAQLTADASPSGADLYRCELPLSSPPTGCDSLVNISAPLPGSGESTEVLGVVSALSEDGTRVYFVARGELDTEANQAGDFAVSGEPNLYLWQQGEGVRFVATLSERDAANWGAPSGQALGEAVLSATGSPNGRYLAFMSERSLAGEGNLNAAWEPVERVFRYDAQTERLDCVSCDPTGAGPEGAVVSADERNLIDPRSQWSGRLVAAVVPQPPVIGLTDARIPLHRTRAVHDNGRIYFNAIDALVPADSNGEWDVYQYEPGGTGTCGASSGDADTGVTAEGCVSLISSGTGEEAAGFFDASVGGGDVFFLTAAPLSVLDEDKEADIYNARVDGIPATLPPSNECLGEACQPAAQAPNDPTPASAAFKGQGSLSQLRDCGSISRRVGRLARRAKGLRSRAKAARSPKAAKQMRGKARRLSRKASRLGKQAKRCRRANRRAAR